MNTQFPFNWPEQEHSKTLVVDAIHADLLALEHHDLKEKITIRCRFCHGRVRFSENWQVPSESQYVCYGVTSSPHILYGDEYCYNKLKRFELAAASAEEIGRRFYVQLDLPEKKIYRMCYEANGPTTGYHFVREITQEEYRQEAVMELEKIREKAVEGNT